MRCGQNMPDYIDSPRQTRHYHQSICRNHRLIQSICRDGLRELRGRTNKKGDGSDHRLLSNLVCLVTSIFQSFTSFERRYFSRSNFDSLTSLRITTTACRALSYSNHRSCRTTHKRSCHTVCRHDYQVDEKSDGRNRTSS